MQSSLLDNPLVGAEPPLILTTAQDFDTFLVPHIDNTEKLVLLLDYDGTLAPIAPHPDMAIIPNETKRVLQRLANCPDMYIALISGRGVANVRSMVGIDNITYAGNHGLEILHPDGTTFTHPLPAGNEETISKLLHALQQEVCRHGAWVENKGVLLTYHYRYSFTKSLRNTKFPKIFRFLCQIFPVFFFFFVSKQQQFCDLSLNC